MAYCILKSYKLKLDPSRIFQALQHEENCFFLDSSLNSDLRLGRYSLLGVRPFYILKTKNQPPFMKLRQLLDRYRVPSHKDGFPFTGGAVGYLSYDLGFLLEKKLSRKAEDDLGIPDSFFAFYNTALAIDHFKKLLYICCVGFPEKNERMSKSLCESNFKRMVKLLSKRLCAKSKPEPGISKAPLELKSNFSRKDYVQAINRAKQHIKAGDIYQVNLSQRFQAKSAIPAFQLFKRLRQVSPSYFGAFLDCSDFQIISSSPERFLKLEEGRVSTRPMKGTRPRFGNRLKDEISKRELLESGKDKAELMMIVDLERNDLGRVCRYDSVKVEALRQLEVYNTVFQTTASITGELHRDKDRIDLLRACFPGGSVTGCPKIRSMQIIDELEPHSRAIYTGSLGYMSFSGNMDFNILIRSILKIKDNLYFSAGGGIVADSVPEAEYEETLVKAKGMMRAIYGRDSFPK